MKPIYTVLMAIWLAAPIAAQASPAEAETLHRVADELAFLESLVHRAQGNKDPRNRVQFDYDRLLADLQNVQGGIKQYLGDIRATYNNSADIADHNYSVRR